MPFDMDIFIRGHYQVLPVDREDQYTSNLIRKVNFDRINYLVNAIHYPLQKNGVNYNHTISRSGIKEPRNLTFLPPRRYNDLASISHYLKEQNAKPAVIHDGLQFVIKYKPYLIHGEIVIGFPGMLRQACNRSDCDSGHFPIIGISEKEIFLDEVPTNIGWEAHWWLGAIPIYDPHFFPTPIYLKGNGII